MSNGDRPRRGSGGTLEQGWSGILIGAASVQGCAGDGGAAPAELR